MIQMERNKILATIKTLDELGFEKVESTDDVEGDKEKMGRRTYMLIEDSSDGASWTQDFTILVVKGRNGKVTECGWFSPKMPVY